MKIKWPFLIFVALATSVVRAQHIEPTREYILKSKVINERLYLYVKLNEKLSGYMLFDNGATRCVIFKRYLKMLRLHPSKGSVGVTLFNQQVDIPIVNNIDIKLSQLISKIPSAYVLEDDNYGECSNIIGTIGSNLINKYNWCIDLKNNEVLCKSDPYTDDAVVFLPYPALKNGNILVSGKILTDSINFFLDFGYDGELLIPSKFSSKLSLFHKPLLGYTFEGNLGGVVANDKSESIAVLKVDSVLLGNVPIYEVNATVGEFNSFNIGTAILKYFKIYINASRNEIGFRIIKEKKLIMPVQEDYGLDFAYDRQKKCYFVSRIFDYFKSTPRFSIGQIVQSINKKKPSDLEYDCAINNYILKCRTMKSFPIIIQNKKYTLTRNKIPVHDLDVR